MICNRMQDVRTCMDIFFSCQLCCVSEFFFVLHSSGGCLDVVKYLVNDVHCDPNVGNKDGETPLHLACR